MANVLEIIISAKDLASGTVTGSMSNLKAATEAYRSTMQRLNGEVNSTVQSLLGIATVTAGIYALKNAFDAGIKAVDDYRLTTIGIAGTLTDMAATGTKNLQAFYDNAKRYAEDTYQKVELAAAKFFASGKEMVQGWQILTQKGVVLTSDQDINNLGIIVDKVKLLTQGQMSSLQIATELRAAMDGQARAGSQLAMILKDQIGPGWDDQLKKAVAEGRVLQFLADVFKGLKYASGDVENTLEAQKSTLGTLLSQVGRQGLSGAYDDIVGIVRDINDYLTTHRDLVATKIKAAWESVGPVVLGITDAVKEINGFAEKNPIAAGWTAEALKVSAALVLIVTGLRALTALWGVFYALAAANLAYLAALFAPIATGVGAISAALAAASAPMAALGVAILAVIAVIAGMTLAKWIGEWEVAGIKIKEYVELGELYLKKFYFYIRDDFAGDVKAAIGSMWDYMGEAVAAALKNAWAKLKGFATAFLEWAKSPFAETAPSGAEESEPSEAAALRLYRDKKAAAAAAAAKAQREANEAAIEAVLARGAARRAASEESAKTTADTSYTAPAVKTPKGSDDDGKKSGSAARALASAELEYAKALAKEKLALIEKEEVEIEHAYKNQLSSAEDYYAKLRELNDRERDAKLAGIEGEIEAVKKGEAHELAAAKTTEAASAISLKSKAKLLELENQIIKAKSDHIQKTDALKEAERSALEARDSATASALSSILGMEQLSAEQRLAVGERYHQAQIDLIQKEAAEIERKTEGRVKAEEIAAAKIKDIQKDLRGYNLAQLDQMVSDEKSSVVERERAWEEINKRIKEGSVSSWEAFRYGLKESFDDLKNEAMRWRDLAKDIISDLKSGFGEFFSDLAAGEKGISAAFKDLQKNLMSSLSKTFGEKLFQEIAGALGKGLASIFGAESAVGKAAGGLEGILGKTMTTTTMSVTASVVNINGSLTGTAGTSVPTGQGASAESAGGGWFASIKSFFSNFFDGIKNLFSGIFNTFSSLISGLGSALSSIGSSIGSLFAGIFHSGGIVGSALVPARSVNPAIFTLAPRLHSGLASDEFPAILQRGEAVIPRGGYWSGDSSQSARDLNVQVQIDNQSSTPLKLEQGSITRDLDKIVVSIVAKDIDQYGVLGRMLKNRK